MSRRAAPGTAVSARGEIIPLCACGSSVLHSECLNAEQDVALPRLALAHAEARALAVYERKRRDDAALGARP